MKEDLNPDLIDEIKKRINIVDDTINYNGFDMSKTHSQEEENERITKHNEGIIDLFKDHLDTNIIKNCFDCWKGVCFFAIDKDYDKGLIQEFPAWASKDIIWWLIKYGDKKFWNKITEEIENGN